MAAIIVGSKKDKVLCICGERMKPVVLKYIVDYKCPKYKWWNFFAHSFPRVFIRE